MALYETTKFSRQKSRSLALQQYRPAINDRLATLRHLANFQGQTPVVSTAAKNAIKTACGNPSTANTHVYEIGIGGHWRIFFAQAYSGGVITLMFGHLNGNTLEEP